MLKQQLGRLVALSLMLVLSACTANHEGFLTNKAGVAPLSQQYEGDKPPLALNNAPDSTVIIYMHGMSNSIKKDNCGYSWNFPPESFRRVANELDNTYLYYLCSKATDGGVPGTYIEKRVKEFDGLVDQLSALGVQPKNIFLAGQSAGGWAALSYMKQQRKKFNAAIATAPACCGKRSSGNSFWRQNIRGKLIANMLEAPKIEALIFAYPEDAYNRPQDLEFLTDAYPDSIKMVVYDCGEGHSTARKDCRLDETVATIKGYIRQRQQEL